MKNFLPEIMHRLSTSEIISGYTFCLVGLLGARGREGHFLIFLVVFFNNFDKSEKMLENQVYL